MQHSSGAVEAESETPERGTARRDMAKWRCLVSRSGLGLPRIAAPGHRLTIELSAACTGRKPAMARKAASTKVTGGGGYGFEDQVAAYYALHLLAATRLFGVDFGRIVRIDFQARDAGWLLDDLVVTFEDPVGIRHVTHSIRSNRQVTTNGFPEDFISDIWEQWIGRDSSPFQEDRDRLVLAVGELAESVGSAWNEMLLAARRTSPDRFVARFTAPRQSSALQRTLFQSLGCPAHLAEGPTTDSETAARLLAHLELLRFDFGKSVSHDWTRLITLAQSVLEGGDVNEAAQLVETLRSLSETLRPSGGMLDLPKLLDHLRGRFRLRPYPDYQVDWARLDAKTESALARTKGVVGDGIALDRHSLRDQVRDLLSEASIAVLFGESGCGKSALAKTLVESGDVAASLVWLSGEVLDGADLDAVSRNLGMQYRLERVICSGGKARTIVVLDALDRTSPQSLLNACELISRLGAHKPDSPIRVLITTEPSGWARIQREFIRLGIDTSAVRTWPVGFPDPAEVRGLLLQTPSLRGVADRAEVYSLLRNLKILDWVAVAAEQGPDPSTLPRVGVTEIIDWVWAYWIGEDADAVARSGVLKKLGELEGNSMSAGLPIRGSLDNSEQRTLGSPALQQLVRVEEERCYFLHDLAGDWARLRVLLGEEAEGLGLIVEKAKLPRWHRAIRYFGQRLLEATPNDPSKWEQVLNRLGSIDPPSFAHDLLLEAVAFAGNAPVLLEQVWPVLCANDGALLRRFLRLFLHSATIPDPRVRAVASSQNEASALASLMRWPYGPYWLPVLRFLKNHQADVARFALGVTARLCRTWLETVPETTVDSRSFPGREEAAELAIRLARELQFLKALGTYFRDDVDETVFETLLLAAPDFPDEVNRLVLEFAQRREWDSAVLERAEQAREAARRSQATVRATPSRQVGGATGVPAGLGLGPFIPHGPRRDPWPDGPLRRVDDAFQKVCLEKPQAFMRLVNVSPAVAREVALAVCIESPRHEEYGWESPLLDRCGLEHWSGGYPNAFFRGCFLTFLRQNPDVGLDLIITLVDFATDRWVDASLRLYHKSPAPPEEQLGPRILLPDAGRRNLLGNSQVYAWYRFGALDNSAVTCALMALEKWLYDEIDADHDVSAWIAKILQRSRSVALAGVLVAVGLKHPELFTSSLSPILSVWPLYDWQEHLVMNGDAWQIEMTSWARDGELVFNIMRDWHTMPHRKASLRDTVIRLFLLSTEVATRFESIREFWRSELEQGRPRGSIELLLARFDPDNYRRTPHGEGQVLVEFEWPDHLRNRTEAARRDSEENLLLINFPFSCRRILDGETVLDSETINQFWQNTERIAALPESADDEEQRSHRAAALCGAAAVLFTHHRDWLRQDNTKEEWLLDQVRSVLGSPPRRSELDIAESHFPLRWDCFAGACLCALLAEAPEERWIRRALAEVVMAFHYDTTSVVMRSAFRLRGHLGDDWSRLLNLAVMWAGLRACINRAGILQQDSRRYLTWRRRVVDAFVGQQVRLEPLAWTRVGRLGRVILSRIERGREDYRWCAAEEADSPGEQRARRRRGHPGLDVQVLQAAFAWIPPLNGASTASERAAWIQEVIMALDVTLSMLPDVSDIDGEVDGTPYDFDRWVFERCAVCVAQMRSDEGPHRLWAPILDLDGKAHYWVSAFLSAWLINGRRAANSHEQYARRWSEMIAYVFASPMWSVNSGRGSFRTAELAAELMGLSWSGRAISEAEFTDVIEALAPQYRAFSDRWLVIPDIAAKFAYFLQRPAARPLRRDGIKWLNTRVASFDDYAWRDEGLEDALLEAVRACWFECSTSMQEDCELREAFLGVLDILNKRQNAGAFELRDEVVRNIRQT